MSFAIQWQPVEGLSMARLDRRTFIAFLLPRCYQDNSPPSAPMSGASWFVVSCGVRLSEVGLSEIRKPQVRFLNHQSNPLNLKTQRGCQRRLDRLPSTARVRKASLWPPQGRPGQSSCARVVRAPSDSSNLSLGSGKAGIHSTLGRRDLFRSDW